MNLPATFRALLDWCSAHSPNRYIWVNDDGTARELDEHEHAYLHARYELGDGNMPYVKRSYRARTPDGRLNGYLRRVQLPWNVSVMPATQSATRARVR